MSKIIAVDVDLTVVDSLAPWMDWFKQRTGRLPQNLNKVYDLVPEMREIVHEEGMSFDPYEFWHHKDLYDGLSPIEGSVEALAEIRNAGDKIIFVSLCDPGHIDSKIAFLKRNFKYDGFVATADKHWVGYDAIIDDRAHHLELGIMHRPHACHFHFTGVYRGTDGTMKPKEAFNLPNWNEAKNLIDLLVK